MTHRGDFDASAVIYGKFTTYRPSTGAAFTLGGTPALSVYKDNSTTQSTAGVTLTADFDSVTGLNHFAIDTSADGTFYSAGSFFDIVITTGTVDGVSVVGAVVGSFTIRKNSALKPTTAGRTLDVSNGGEAGVDWANVGSPTTALNLSGTTIAATQKVDVDTIKTNPVVNAGTITFPSGATLASKADTDAVKSDTAAVKLKTDNLPSDPADASDIAGAFGTVNSTLATIAGYVDTEVASIKAQTDKLVFTVPNQLDVNVLGWKGATAPAMTGDAFDRLGAPAGASISADVAAIKSDTAALKEYPDRTVIRGTVDAGASTTVFTPSALSPTGVDVDQFKGRVVLFDNDTLTPALRGQGTRVVANTAAGLPDFTVDELTTAPAAGDTFSVV